MVQIKNAVKDLAEIERIFFARSRELILEQQKAFVWFQRQTQELEACLDAATEAIARFDADLRYLYVNPIAERVLGKTRADLLGKTVTETSSGSIGLSWEKYLRLTFATAQEQEIEFEFETQFGVRFYQAWLVPELVTNNKPMSVIVISRDLTGTKQLKRQHTQLLASQETYSSRS
uniref:PAS domain S-box protein n=1 Tax=Oscillatoriales cyanobacterium SpSt-418 TaxID=2282169 RepID=A0A7C3KGM2_9CYAN